MATALITGSSGLIGRRVLQQWPHDDFEAVLVDRSREDLLEPGTPMALIERHRPAVVVHLAWCASSTPGYRHSPDNARWVAASLELAAAARASGASTFATGTALDSSGGGDAYASAKGRLRELLAPAVRNGELTWLRPFYVVSPEDGTPQVVADALRAARAGVPVELRTPESPHDFIHVDDVARAIVTCVQHRLHGTVDIGTGGLHTVHALAEALGAHPAPPTGPGPDFPHHHQAADTAALAAVGWHPTTTEELFRHA